MAKCGIRAVPIRRRAMPTLATWLQRQRLTRRPACLEATGSYQDALATRLHDAGLCRQCAQSRGHGGLWPQPAGAQQHRSHRCGAHCSLYCDPAPPRVDARGVGSSCSCKRWCAAWTPYTACARRRSISSTSAAPSPMSARRSTRRWRVSTRKSRTSSSRFGHHLIGIRACARSARCSPPYSASVGGVHAAHR